MVLTKHYLKNSEDTEIDENLRAHAKGYKVDALTLPYQTLSIFAEWLMTASEPYIEHGPTCSWSVSFLNNGQQLTASDRRNGGWERGQLDSRTVLFTLILLSKRGQPRAQPVNM
ncbi:hypothetical protein EVAR_44054_1 [Eumeta japonica]|uniref:Uncharacterized protein n=1 Tax=Eumeta variegata TaxID=151549 RepID=A0A4C1XGD4_EUMVA|nr:hypothetical protein EVAR_44054_1 [Eumeta japonica]